MGITQLPVLHEVRVSHTRTSLLSEKPETYPFMPPHANLLFTAAKRNGSEPEFYIWTSPRELVYRECL